MPAPKSGQFFSFLAADGLGTSSTIAVPTNVTPPVLSEPPTNLTLPVIS